MADAIEVLVSGQGTVSGDVVAAAPETRASCELCGTEVDAVAAIGDGRHACAPCLRARLEAMSVAKWRFRAQSASGLPWGKLTS